MKQKILFLNKMLFKNKSKFFLSFDFLLWFVLAFVLIISHLPFILPRFKELILIIVAYGATIPVFFSAFKALKNKRLSIDLLASIALFFSIFAKQWDSVIFINLMLTSARIFSNYVETKTHSSIESLLKMKPKDARVERNGEIIKIPIEMIKKGDRVIVELGERIPVDGAIEKGEAEIDQSSLTGESLPVFKKVGDKVFSSTIVKSGNLIIKAEKVGKETMLEKIIDLVEKSQKNKAKIITLSEKFTAWYILLSLLGSFLLYIISKNLLLVLGILLVTCADDIAVAVPLAFLVSIGHAARHGLIIKGSEFIEALSKIKVLIFDKTGTLTRGKMKVQKVFLLGDLVDEAGASSSPFANARVSEEEFLKAAGAASLLSQHPISQAIFEYVKKRDISIEQPEKFIEYSGKGAMTYYKNKKILSGTLSFLKESNVKITKNQLAIINREKEHAFSMVFIGIENEMVGFFTLADEIRPGVKEVITELKRMGIKKIVMLTGDNERIARSVADTVGIKEFQANLLPEDKVNYVKKYLNKKYTTVMIGDGINDAAALVISNVGIAMGVIGSDVAIESAHIALMRDEINQIPELIKLSKSTSRVVRQNFLIWGIVNVIGLILVFNGILGPEGAAAYNFVTDFLPLINNLQLFR
jgi:heavy metal translocating P-type ATPase